jgi:hypothetical protein
LKWRHNWEKHFYINLYWSKPFSTKPISIKLDANYPSMKGNQVYLDRGTDPHQRGDNHKNANIGWSHSKNLVLKNQ